MERQPYIPAERRPRDYAVEIRALPESEQAAAIAERVPEKFQSAVRDHLWSWRNVHPAGERP